MKTKLYSTQKPANRVLDFSVFIWFAIVLMASMWALTRQWDKPLLDMHSFRQTQTAISAYYMAKDLGVFLNYITPVLGKPWQIPMEVPIYQWIVARWHNISEMGLDQSGKLVSIAFWLACFWPVWKLLGLLNFSRSQRCLTASVIYSSPLYLYWARAFMMETTGLFFSLGMVAFALAGFQRRDWCFLLVALGFGIAAALCKVTTYALAMGVAGLLFLFSQGLPKRRDWVWITFAGLAVTLPIIPAKIWLAYGDSLKQQNPFAREIILASSAKQQEWNFGTLHQKLDPATWEHIWRHVTDQLLVSFPLIGPLLMMVVLVVGATLSPKRIPLILIFLAGFASGPIIFTNLYFEHSYYWCANGIWLLLAVGTALAGIWEYRPRQVLPQTVAAALSLLIAVSGFLSWHYRFLPILQSLPTREQFDLAWRTPIQNFIPPDRTILVVGNDWNPVSLYYAERKGIAYPTGAGIAFPAPQFQESLSKMTHKDALGAVVIADPLLTARNQTELGNILQSLGIAKEGTRTAFGAMFLAEDLKKSSPPLQ